MTADRETLKKVNALCGKLKSAWALQVGFESRVSGLLPEIIALPSEQIDACLEKAAKGDPLRRACLVPIACEHLFHPSLHHRIGAWLEDESLPFRDKVMRAVGSFRLAGFAPYLDRFLVPDGPGSERQQEEVARYRQAALEAISQLKAPENLPALRRLLDDPARQRVPSYVQVLANYPGDEARPLLQSWFRECEGIDQHGIAARLQAGEFSDDEKHELFDKTWLTCRVAEMYGALEKREVIDFLVKHLDIGLRLPGEPGLGMNLLLDGERATSLIARLNGWDLEDRDHDLTKEGSERSRQFIGSLWSAFRADPALAYQAECPVKPVYPAKHKLHKLVDRLLAEHGKLIEEDAELGYWLRQETEGDGMILAMHIRRGGSHWRIVRLSDGDREEWKSGKVPARHLFFRYSHEGALVAYHAQVLVNASDLENRYAKAAVRKLEKIAARKTEKKEASNSGETGQIS
ncbi:hypothetical protein [Luteolibacter luteus]|uniref:Uncharacterized protein n=1 Tax=Luteolibacter luteus TaxID=2728835 RepID=A0A858RKW0_9BACT|nr:hypothetical protein [Luteolibacter luteus]QJE97956.1 hypothetical protein HHL09_19920 [Luteolibacter luteus]